jgi:hypothetical protein
VDYSHYNCVGCCGNGFLACTYYYSIPKITTNLSKTQKIPGFFYSFSTNTYK